MGEGAALGGNPVQYEVRGLPPGQDAIFVEQNVRVRPIRWQISRKRDGVHGREGDFATPQDALAALEDEFFGKRGV